MKREQTFPAGSLDESGKAPVKKKTEIIVSETRSGKVVREKCGAHLLWRKEFHAKYSFFILDIQKMICRDCGRLIELESPRRVYVKFGTVEVQTLVCELCTNVNVYEFGDGALPEAAVSIETKHKHSSPPNKKVETKNRMQPGVSDRHKALSAHTKVSSGTKSK